MFGDRKSERGAGVDFGKGGTSRLLRSREVRGLHHMAVLAACKAAVDGRFSKTVDPAQAASVAQVRALLSAARH